MRRVALVLIASVLMAAPTGAHDGVVNAARTGDLEAIRKLLTAGVNPNVDRSHSPLMFAAGNGNVEMTRLLLAHGARVDYRDHNGDRALLWAAQRGHAETVRLLLAARAAVDSDDDPYRRTPLMRASWYGHIEVVRLLLVAGADPKRRDHTDDTALHWAALSRKAELVSLLLKAGADPKAVGKYTLNTPLHQAATYGRADIVRLLTDAGSTLEERDHRGKTALWLAASLDQEEAVEALLAAGADPDARDASGATPFVAAISRSGAAAYALVDRTRDIDRGFAAAVWGGYADLALRLAARGADANATDDLGRAGVAGVVRHQGTMLLEWFLANGVDLTRHGGSVLTSAAGAGRLDLVTLLLDTGVPVEARDASGASALLHAASAGQVAVVRLLLARGADRNPRDKDGKGLEDYMTVRTGGLSAHIKKRQMSRAHKPTAQLQVQLKDLTVQHAQIKALLAQ